MRTHGKCPSQPPSAAPLSKSELRGHPSCRAAGAGVTRSSGLLALTSTLVLARQTAPEQDRARPLRDWRSGAGSTALSPSAAGPQRTRVVSHPLSATAGGMGAPTQEVFSLFPARILTGDVRAHPFLGPRGASPTSPVPAGRGLAGLLLVAAPARLPCGGAWSPSSAHKDTGREMRCSETSRGWLPPRPAVGKCRRPGLGSSPPLCRT